MTTHLKKYLRIGNLLAAKYHVLGAIYLENVSPIDPLALSVEEIICKESHERNAKILKNES